jgi:hypothetical protein
MSGLFYGNDQSIITITSRTVALAHAGAETPRRHVEEFAKAATKVRDADEAAGYGDIGKGFIGL